MISEILKKSNAASEVAFINKNALWSLRAFSKIRFPMSEATPTSSKQSRGYPGGCTEEWKTDLEKGEVWICNTS